MHRWDAESASGDPSGFDPILAADGIDETVDAYATRVDEFPTTSTWTLAVHAVDTGDRWHLTVTPNGITTVRGGGPADVVLSGAASDLLLVLSNRLEDSTITVAGDHDLLNVWHTNVRRRWTFTTDYS